MEIRLTDQNFEQEIKNAQKPFLVDFWAIWCAPCSILGPILDKIAKDYEDKIILGKANMDAVPITASKFGITQIPTVVLFWKGKPISGFVGARPEHIIKEWLDKTLKEIEQKESEQQQEQKKSEQTNN
ncbi:thioredoxin [bacterium]|nr:thioredoxin [bacterium]